MEEYFNLDEAIVVSKLINKYRYELMDFRPHVSVSYLIYCYSSADVFIKVLTGKIEGEEYSNWGDDDTYIDDLMKSKVLSS
jgi:hypothetical protein